MRITVFMCLIGILLPIFVFGVMDIANQPIEEWGRLTWYGVMSLIIISIAFVGFCVWGTMKWWRREGGQENCLPILKRLIRRE